MSFLIQDSDRLAILQSLKTCILLHDAKTKEILWANATACQALGFSVEELLPLKAGDMTRNEVKYRREIGLQWLDDAASKGESIIEWCYRAKNGTEILSEAIATRVTLHDREALMVQFRDIGAEERIKQDLRRLEHRLKEFMQDLVEGIAILAEDGRIKYLSESARPLLGMTEENSCPENFLAFCAPGQVGIFSRYLTDAYKTYDSVAFRYQASISDGTIRWHDVTCRQIDFDDELTGVLLHFRDVTAHVQEHEALRRNERKIEYMARYNAMGEMAMTLSHELSQPVASARSFIEGGLLRLAAPTTAAGSIEWGLKSAVKQLERVSSIIKSVRDYVVKLEQVADEIDLQSVLDDVRYFIDLRAREEKVTVVFARCPEPLPVRCERVLIGQVILNFAFNAMETMRDMDHRSRTVHIATRKAGAFACLSVSDTGPGLPTDLKDQIFEGFFTGKASGNGLGLSVCDNIISRHEGKVWAEPNQPCGTAFSFTLPLSTNR